MRAHPMSDDAEARRHRLIDAAFAEGDGAAPALLALSSSCCNACGAHSAPNRCARCLDVRYCNVTCQRVDWAAHKTTCRPCRIPDVVSAVADSVQERARGRLIAALEAGKAEVTAAFAAGGAVGAAEWLAQRSARVGLTPAKIAAFKEHGAAGLYREHAAEAACGGTAVSREWASSARAEAYSDALEGLAAKGLWRNIAGLGCGWLEDEDGEGNGTHERGYRWALRAAEHGDGDGLFGSGCALLWGRGTAQDFPRAFDLLQRAGDAGNKDALIFAALMLRGGEEVPNDAAMKDLGRSLALLVQADAAGALGAAAHIAFCHLNGVGVARSWRRGFEWLEKAARNDPTDIVSLQLLARCFRDGFGVKANKAEALRWKALADALPGCDEDFGFACIRRLQMFSAPG